jgi:tetratricopeptide (TPR) repeat protein
MNKNLIIFQDALACHQRGELAVATRKYRKLIKQIPDHLDALHHLGMIYKAEGRLDLAEPLFRRCVELDPGFPPIYNSLGDLLATKGDFMGALECGERAVKLMPNNVNALLLIARSHSGLGKPDLALAAYQRVLLFNPKAYQAYNNSGNIHLMRGEYDLALACFDKVIDIEPSRVSFNSVG